MKIFPAIDLLDGEVVRLEEGKREEKQTYGRPLEFARKFARNVDMVHVVDLDGAFSGEPQHLGAVREIIDKTGLDVQFGGGLRSLEALQEVKEAGVKNPVIGTKARDLEFLAEAAEIHNGLTASLDVGEDGLMVEGWKRSSSLTPVEAFEKMKKHVERFVFTAVNRDGKLDGIADVQPFWKEREAEVIYAGGVTAMEDLNELEKRGFDGAIIGKALYEEEIELQEAVAVGDKDAG